MDIHLLILHLDDVASGAYTPKDDECVGVCDLYYTACRGTGFSPPEITQIFTDIFPSGTRLGDPLGDFWREGSLWKGERGARRRELAGKVAAWLRNHYGVS